MRQAPALPWGAAFCADAHPASKSTQQSLREEDFGLEDKLGSIWFQESTK